MENSKKVGGFVCFSSLSLAVSKQATETEFRLECPSSGKQDNTAWLPGSGYVRNWQPRARAPSHRCVLGASSLLVLTSPQFSGLQWESSPVSFENVLGHKPQTSK